jgi:Flp pilus assembly protein TadG
MRMDIRSERGTTLIETAIASAILLIVMVGLLSMAALAAMYTENHGHLEARTTEYAQDKMEQLLTLSYSDSHSDTTYFPATPTGGTGLAVGGSINTSAPVNGYVDWLRNNGDLLHGGVTPPADWFYQRVWQVTTPATGLKQITVVSTVKTALGGEMKPKSTVVVLKASKF